MNHIFPITFRLMLTIMIMSLMPVAAVQAQDTGFTETFDDPALPGWDHSLNASVVNGALRIEPGGFALRPGAWGDMTLAFRVRYGGQAALFVQYRVTELGGYRLSLEPSFAALHRGDGELAAAPTQFSPGEWVQISITVSGEQHQVNVNGITVLTAADPNLLPPGGIMFRVEGGAFIEVDDVSLNRAPGQAQPADSIPTREQPTFAVPAQPGPSNGASIPAYQAGSWVATGGPPGGLGYDIRMQPDNPDIMYVTASPGGIFKSTDGGLNWFSVNNEIMGGFGAPWIFTATIDPHDTNTIWVGTQGVGHIYRSTDGGQTWEARDQGIGREGYSVRGITIDPHDPNIVYSGVEIGSPAWAGQTVRKRHDLTQGAVYKSTDAGENWMLVWKGENLARYILVDPRNSSRLYVSTGIFDRDAANSDVPNGVWGGVGVLRSDDGGQTWTVLDEHNGLGGVYIPSLFMHPENPDILLVGVAYTGDEPGAYITRDGGDTWDLVLKPPVGYGIDAVEIARLNTNIWYAGTENMIWRSEDAGQTWQQFEMRTVDRMAGMPIDLQVDPRDPYRIFVNNYGGGNMMSEDGGQTWVDASRGYTGLKARGLIAAPFDAASVLIPNFRTDDGGVTWRGAQTLDLHGYNFYANPGGDAQSVLAAGPHGSVFYSADGGLTWMERSTVYDLGDRIMGMPALRIAPSDPMVVYTSFSIGFCGGGDFLACHGEHPGFFRSSDGGFTWDKAESIPFAEASVLVIAVHPSDSQTLLVGTADGLFLSRDGGSNFEHIAALETAAFQTPPADPAVYPQAEHPFIYDVAFDPFDANTLYAASIPGAVLRSDDGGATWRQASAGMDPNEKVFDLELDPSRQGVLYAASSLSGVFVSTDGANTWRLLVDGLWVTAVNGITLSQDGSVLYAGTEGAGVFRLGTPSEVPGPGPVSAPGTTEPPPAGVTQPTGQAPTATPKPSGRSLPCLSGALPLAVVGLVWLRRKDRPAIRKIRRR